ncbi:hypothetical protein A2642_04475 [Candidatus Nomurabacteria bacterium RIFCSPHIGHO2_01_FULL_39_10]|uniref:Phosphatidic acid phosphatase type 2/haloperoxidase domain-containing protein n=1 Tax=Candidatus Nomurabacteria bacterium RIFCSPHIGHO2_01_FULL_39_10 TaxID=1801733 RepID=A0A1F6V4C7_9BACT|nr:MAG: hypothetical protein A2642_04475 [Candidatus Nomurabacteria bacterium RIFCSPHIGHO2_01_FULL_39_10]
MATFDINMDIKKGLWKDVTALGGTFFFFIILAFLISLGYTTLFIQLVAGFLFTAIIITLSRIIYFKPRPKPKEYTNFIERIDASSFPSWHAARIILLALTLHFFFKNKYISLILTIVALLVCYSRIRLQKHDWIDIGAGIVLGALTYWVSVKII